MSGLRILDIPKTRFIVISKSGTTGETLAQTLTAFRFIEEAGHGDLIPRLFLGVTEPERTGVANGLRSLFAVRNIPILPHDIEIGGRYSAFTTVGILPALARGLDPLAFRAGGRDVADALGKARKPSDHPAAVGAALSVALAKEKGICNCVMLPYSDRLARFSAWHVQLWAESLGKGGEGTTPVAALGPVDQHSQLQLWMEGPPHFLTILRIIGKPEGGDGLAIPSALAAEAGAGYLGGRTIGDLVRAQQRAIAEALVEARRPVRTIDLDRLDIATLGSLMMHFMIETILAADLLGVDPFDQPGVERGKKLTRQYLSG